MRISQPALLFATTACSIAWLLWPGTGRAQLDDLGLARSVLSGEVAQHIGRVEVATRRAVETVVPATPTPRLAFRHEQAGGGVTAAGLEVDFDLSGRADRARQAGALVGSAAALEARERRLETLCTVRRLGLQARRSEALLALREAAQRELEGLAAEVQKLVAGREKAAFDGERVALKVALHARQVDAERAEVAAARAALAAWLGPFEGPVVVEPADPGPAFLETAAQHSPRLEGLRRQVAGAQARRAVGERWWVPGVGVYGAWRVDTPEVGEATQGFEAGLTVELPFVDRGAAERAQADADRARFEAELAAAEQALRAELAALAAALSRLDAEEKTLDLETFADRARLRFRSGVAPLADLFEALEAVEAHATATAERAAQRRRLRLDLACTAGVLPEPALEALLEAK